MDDDPLNEYSMGFQDQTIEVKTLGIKGSSYTLKSFFFFLG